MNAFFEKWNEELEDLKIHLSLGEEELAEAFDKQKARFQVYADQLKQKLDEAGVDGQSFRIPDPRVRRRRDIPAYRFNIAIANDDRGFIENFTGLDHHLAADQRVNAHGLGPEAGWENFRERGKSDKAENDAQENSHRKPKASKRLAVHVPRR